MITAVQLGRAADRVKRSSARYKGDLAERDALIAAALAEGQTQTEVARAVGVSRVWIHRMAQRTRNHDAPGDAGTSPGPTTSGGTDAAGTS